MFESVGTRSWAQLAIGTLLAAALAAAVMVPYPVARARRMLAGHDPRLPPFAEQHLDFPTTDSPFALALSLDQQLSDVDRARALAAADDLAAKLGWWLLTDTGTADPQAAEVALWKRDDDPDDLVHRWALWLKNRNVYSRPAFGTHLAPDEKEPNYVHPDELLWVFLHAAWRLDLRATVVPSPVHWYVLLREPGGDGVRGVETTCFRCPDADEPSVGLRLLFDEDFYPSGVGGIRNPTPLPPGVYTEVGPEALAGIALTSAERRATPDLARLAAHLDANPTDAGVGSLLYQSALARGVVAAREGRWDDVQTAADALATFRRDHAPLGPPDHDDRVLAAALAFSRKDSRSGGLALSEVLRFRDAEWGRVEKGKVVQPKSEAHDLALWLAIEHGAAAPDDWNLRVVPLLNRHQGDPIAVDRLCAYGRRALAGTSTRPEDEFAGCAGH